MTERNESNQELDALVAEKVMRLMPCSNWKETYGGWLAGECWMHEGEQHDNCFNVKAPPKYSSQMNMAWEIVEKIAESKEVWQKFIESLPRKNDFFDKNNADAAEIICRVALEIIKE